MATAEQRVTALFSTWSRHAWWGLHVKTIIAEKSKGTQITADIFLHQVFAIWTRNAHTHT